MARRLNPLANLATLSGLGHAPPSCAWRASPPQVRAFLSAPAKSEKGLPKRPVVGTAVSIQLNLDEAQVAEWFGAGYD